MSVDWSLPVQFVTGARARVVGSYNLVFGPHYLVVEVSEEGFDFPGKTVEVNENGFDMMGYRSVMNVPPAKIKVPLIVYAVYDRHGEYLESCENLKDAQDVSSFYSDSTIVEMTGEVEMDAPVPCNTTVTCKFYAAVDRDGTVFFWGTHKAHMEDTISKCITPLVLVEFDKTIEWPHNA